MKWNSSYNTTATAQTVKENGSDITFSSSLYIHAIGITTYQVVQATEQTF